MKPKTLTLTHPDSDPITVLEGHEEPYLTQGWEIDKPAKDA